MTNLHIIGFPQGIQECEWKGTPDPNVFYENIDQVPTKLLKIIETFGSCFDEEWYYWKPKPRKNPHAAATTIKKIRVIYAPQKRIPAEKPKKGKQLKL